VEAVVKVVAEEKPVVETNDPQVGVDSIPIFLERISSSICICMIE
jgi:hypothetical protein